MLDVVWTLIQITVGVVGFLTIVFTPVVVFVRRPVIRVRSKIWVADTHVPWRFAAVDICNQRPPRWAVLVNRETATSCRVLLEFRRRGELAIPPVRARWSGRPEPLRSHPVTRPDGSVEFVTIPAPELVPESTSFDLPATGAWEEVAVAVLQDDGEAFA